MRVSHEVLPLCLFFEGELVVMRWNGGVGQRTGELLCLEAVLLIHVWGWRWGVGHVLAERPVFIVIHLNWAYNQSAGKAVVSVWVFICVYRVCVFMDDAEWISSIRYWSHSWTA